MPPFECAERMDFILKRLSNKNFGTLVDPHPVESNAVHKIHEPVILHFLTPLGTSGTQQDSKARR